jgi:hypothetical protein
MRLRSGAAWLAAVVLAGPAAAQEHPLFVIHQEFAKPSQVAEYEASTKEFAAMVTRNKSTMPHFAFTALSSEDFVYTYVVRIPNYGGIDGIGQDFLAVARKEGAAYAELMRRGGATTDHVREWVVSEAPELSYVPASPRLPFAEARFFHYDTYYLMPGRELEVDGLAKEFAALFKAKNIPNGYRIFRTEMGPEMPAIIVEVGAKDAADYYTQSVSDRAILGDTGKALFAKAFAMTRRFEQRDAWLRPDLSALPAPAAPR